MAKGKYVAGVVHREAVRKGSGAKEFEPYSTGYATEASARRVAESYAQRLLAVENDAYLAAVKGPRTFFTIPAARSAPRRDRTVKRAKLRERSKAAKKTVRKIKRQPSEAQRLHAAVLEWHEVADATVPGSSYWGYIERIARRHRVKPLDLSDAVESSFGMDGPDPDIVQTMNWRLSDRDRAPARRGATKRKTVKRPAKRRAKVKRPARRDREKLYRVIWKRDDLGTAGILFPGPLTHREATTASSKSTRHGGRHHVLEELTPTEVVALKRGEWLRVQDAWAARRPRVGEVGGANYGVTGRRRSPRDKGPYARFEVGDRVISRHDDEDVGVVTEIVGRRPGEAVRVRWRIARASYLEDPEDLRHAPARGPERDRSRGRRSPG